MTATTLSPIDRAHHEWRSALNDNASRDTVNRCFEAWQAEVRKLETPEQTADRLEREAVDFENRADRMFKLAREYFDKASRRRFRGDLEQAQADTEQFEAYENSAIAALDQGLTLRREAALINARLSDAKALVEVVS